MKELTKQLAQVQKELKAPKNQRNTFGNYNYRSCEDILEAVKPLLPEGTVVIIKDEVIHFPSSHTPQIIDVVYTGKDNKQYTRKELVNFDRFYVKATATFTDGESSVDIVAYAREEDDKKGMDGSQVTGAASSYARKYALNGLFAIDDTKDADTQEGKTKEPAAKRAASTPAKTQSADLLTTAQMGKIGALGSQLNYAPTKTTAIAKRLYKKETLPELSKSEASDLISKLQGLLDKAAAEPKEEPQQEEQPAPADITETFNGELPQGDDVLAQKPIKEDLESIRSTSEEIKKKAATPVTCQSKGCENTVTPTMASKSIQKYGKALCMVHQLKEGAVE